MTRLIYRGFEHDGFRAPVVRQRHDLIYRGVRHDGLASLSAVDRAGVILIYRGVRHGAPERAAMEPGVLTGADTSVAKALPRYA